MRSLIEIWEDYKPPIIIGFVILLLIGGYTYYRETTSREVDGVFQVIYKQYEPSHWVYGGKNPQYIPEDFITTVQCNNETYIITDKVYYISLLKDNCYKFQGKLYRDFDLHLNAVSITTCK